MGRKKQPKKTVSRSAPPLSKVKLLKFVENPEVRKQLIEAGVEVIKQVEASDRARKRRDFNPHAIVNRAR